MMLGLHEIKPFTDMTNKPDKSPACIRPINAFAPCMASRTNAPFAQSQWFYSSPEEHFRSVQSPSHLENWLAVNEVRIITHVTHHQNQNRTGQRNITDFLTPTVQTAPTPLQPPSVTTMSASIANAPLTREPGRFADDGLRARR